MARGRPKAKFVMRRGEREQWEGLADSRSLPAGLVNQARTILLSAEGITNRQIARRLGMTKATVGKWCRRFIQFGVSGLYDELRPGRPRSISDERVAQPVAKTLQMRPKNGTHWSVRGIAGSWRR